ncbi:MAG: CotH kinase family protein [Eubacteriales bacterium]
MKYKLITIISCVCAFAIAFPAYLFSQNVTDRVHQHLESTEKTECVHNHDIFCSHLPIVAISTDGVVIPGKPIYDENNTKTERYTLSAEGTTTVRGKVEIKDSKETNNHTYDASAVSSSIEIRVRGNSSRSFDKSSYLIKLVNEDENNNLKVMGMDAHHEWILYGPYLDKTLLRNYMWYNIAGEIMDYAPNVRFCEVFVNDEYMGLYVMTESITAGNDEARLNLSVNRNYNTYTGYLLRLDLNIDNVYKNINNFTTYAKRTKQTIEIVYPGKANLTDVLKREIEQDFSDFEKALYSYDYNDKKYGYDEFIDTQSFADYFLINEFTSNYDAGWLSTYIYKDMDDKYRMCIWDFNSSCDNYNETIESKAFLMQHCLWYFMLIKDKDFTQRLTDRYYTLRKTYFSEEYLNNYIDEVVAYLGDAIDRNYEKWGYAFEEEYDMLIPAERNPRSYEESISSLKNFLKERTNWLDENIETLNQYSADSKVKKFDKNAN